ncbi:hypothetical protein FNV43_RR07085 [Rhamnella rubrinervis]|uniref:Uncharacterized protein n=1 Tax=Rhamnella rubrinervis TaxID=2594499 RepID=A0A8K0MLV8_9ROSA|nr:hypothetical protein FNV43_RR07085 [Rhamnella rubrinervis]
MKVNNNIVQNCLLLIFAFLPLLIIPVQARILPAVSAGDNKLSMIIRQVYGRPKPSPPPAPPGSKSPTQSSHTNPCDSADSNYQIKSILSPEDQSSSSRKAIKPSPPPPPRRGPPIHPILSRTTTTPVPPPSIPSSSQII